MESDSSTEGSIDKFLRKANISDSPFSPKHQIPPPPPQHAHNDKTNTKTNSESVDTTANSDDVLDALRDSDEKEQEEDHQQQETDNDDDFTISLNASIHTDLHPPSPTPPLPPHNLPPPTSLPKTLQNQISQILKVHGFKEVHTDVDLTESLSDLLWQFSKRGDTINSMKGTISTDRGERLDLSIDSIATQSGVDKYNKKLEGLQRKVELANLDCNNVTAQLGAVKKKAAAEIRKLKSQLNAATMKGTEARHKIKAQALILTKLTEKLSNVKEMQAKKLDSSREVFRVMQNRDPRRASPVDSKALEVISLYEESKERDADEIRMLVSKVKVLEKEVRIKNAINSSSNNENEDNEELRRNVEGKEVENYKLLENQSSLKFNLEKLNDKLKNTLSNLTASRDECENLREELEFRPSPKQWKESEKLIDELERKLYSAVEAAQEVRDIRELRRFVGTSSLISEDKLNHRLHLDRLDSLPREVSKDILKSLCRELEITDATLILPCIKKMGKAMLMLPRLERFINDVCSYVFHNANNTKSKNGVRQTMEEILPILKTWNKQLNTNDRALEFKAIVIGELCRRSIVPSDLKSANTNVDAPGHTSEMSDEQALRSIRDLVELEKLVLARDDLYTNAESTVSSNPDLFVNKVVLHFRYLFSVKDMSGIFPKMNEVYLFANEMNSFVRELRVVFGLEKGVTTAGVVKRVIEIAGELKGSDGGDGNGGGDGGGGVGEEGENFVVM